MNRVKRLGQRLCVGALALALASASFAQDAAGPSAAPAAASEPTVMLRLKSGDVLFGSVMGHDSEGVRFRRVDTGGTVALTWSFLDPTESEELRLRFGYVDTDADELLIDAERLVLDDNTEVVGLIVNRTDEYVWLKTESGTTPIAKRRLQGQSTLVRVPALDIFTRDELYQQRAFELQAALLLDGPEGAAAHDELAEYSERLFDYRHALEHYSNVAKLAPEFDAERVAIAIARCEKKAAVQDQVDLLETIDRYRTRKRYDLAIESLRLFPELYPDSPLLEDWNKLRDRVGRHQARDLREAVVRHFHARVARLARDAAKKKKTYEEVLAYLDEGMLDELLQAVQRDLEELAPGIEGDEIQRLWTEREAGRYRQASFGLGTWLLGDSRARETYEEKEDETPDPKKGSQAEARKKLEDRIKRYLQNQELTRRAKAGGAAGEEDPAKYWLDWDYAGRYHWIVAYFVEFSGLFQIDRVRFANCRECGGTGARDIVYSGSAIAGDAAQNRLVPCPACHTIGVVRRIRYR